MTQFYALSPKQAIEVIKAAGVEDAARLIADHAAAGLVKSYAQMQVTIDARGERANVRGAAVAADVWERMIGDDATNAVWSGGTVRLAGSELVGGTPAVHVTGVAFHPDDIKKLAHQQRPAATSAAMRRPPQPSPPTDDEAAPHAAQATAQRLAKRQPDPTAIPPGAILCTIKQAGDALGIGRTKVNELLNNGQLVRREVGSTPRITVESVNALAAGS